MESKNSSAKPPRIALLDVARGIALIAMTIYHFAWDLQFFGWVVHGTISQPGWVAFARSIATTFLFLVGFSLVLAHGDTIRWRGFWVRFAQVAGAATLISIATYIMDPRTFIFFGILHAIALFSLFALPFTRLPWWGAGLAALAVFGIWHTYQSDIFAADWLRWVGLAFTPPTSNDYVPVFPWLAATLLGVMGGQLTRPLWTKLASMKASVQPLNFIGQHSLIYYLLHQPLMIGGLWLFTTFVAQPDPTANFLQLCELQCLPNQDATFCVPYCGCVADDMKREKIFADFNAGKIRLNESPQALSIIKQCAAKSE